MKKSARRGPNIIAQHAKKNKGLTYAIKNSYMSEKMAITENHGAHGTTASRAEIIERTGFCAGGASFWGKGVYFFHRFPDGRDLASKWHVKALEAGLYDSDKDQRCAVIYAKIQAEEENVFDLYDPGAYQLFFELLQTIEEKERENGKKYSPEEKNHIRNKWLQQYEAQHQTKIKVLCCSIPVPKKQFRPIKETCCIVVRDVDCIRRPYEIEVLCERKDAGKPSARS